LFNVNKPLFMANFLTLLIYSSDAPSTPCQKLGRDFRQQHYKEYFYEIYELDFN